MIVFVVSGRTESGDSWSLAFSSYPSEEFILEEIQKDEWLKEEYESDCISGWDIDILNIIEINKEKK